jgi:RNase H-like domain found in reverse transcriptase
VNGQSKRLIGYWLTPIGLKPWKKKIAAILAMQQPVTVKQFFLFLGVVNYYQDMFPKRAHILAPLTTLSGTQTLKWSPECQSAFDPMKAIIARDTFLKYPGQNKQFDIYCDASNLQLGAAIMQDSMLVAFYLP